MGAPRIPYVLRPLYRREENTIRLDSLSLYVRFLRKVVNEGVVPIGFETITRTFEAYSTPQQRKKYGAVIEDSREHAAYLRRKDRTIIGNMHQFRIRQRLLDFLEEIKDDVRDSPHFY